MDNISGPPVEGANFFGRGAEVGWLRETLEHHDVLLLGPRRIGKTSVARAVMQLLGKTGWRTLEVNVASCQDERGFLRKLEDALRVQLGSLTGQLWDSLKTRLAKLGERIETVKIPVPGAGTLGVDLAKAASDDWTTLGNEVLALLAELDQRWLIYVDELPIFLFNIVGSDAPHGVARVRRFLDWFRNDVRGLPGHDRVRWLVSGSVGLDTLVQQHGMADTINTLRQYHLPEFSEQAAQGLLTALTARYSLGLLAADQAALLAGVQWRQPYYIQFAFSQLRQRLAAEPGAPLSGLIDQAIDAMAQPGIDNDFHHWERRLFLQLPKAHAQHAVALLALAAVQREGARPENLMAGLQGRLPDATDDEARQLFLGLRDILQRDGYWVPTGEGPQRRYRFTLEPLRRWWVRRNTP